uniref:Uncharacterized protein n=1 Tax=Anguilla anguilla TaxID=7936 RepID=A0A0E9T4M5_ANGAN
MTEESFKFHSSGHLTGVNKGVFTGVCKGTLTPLKTAI